MSKNTKLSEVISQFDGSTQFSEWIRKFELVMKLQKQKELQYVLPLFLSGEAFNVYESLNEVTKDDYLSLIKELKKAFTADVFVTYEDFISRKLGSNESVDNFVAQLKTMANTICEDISENLVKCAFINGLPLNIKNQLKACCMLEELDLSQVVGKARLLVGKNSTVKEHVKNGKNESFNPTCPECGRNHLRKFCPLLKGKCFHCKGEHMLKDCPIRYPKNGL